MIVLKQEAMSSVWDDAVGIMLLEKRNRLHITWGERMQYYFWANGIEYRYNDKNNSPRKLVLNVVICFELWTEVHSHSTGKEEECKTRYAWLSSAPLNPSNVFKRCTKLGRYRWGIESGIQVEKHQGYSYEHCYSYTWKVMEGYHYLMKIGHFLNTMASISELLNEQFRELGIQGFFKRLWIICNNGLLNCENILKAANSLKQWRLIPAP